MGALEFWPQVEKETSRGDGRQPTELALVPLKTSPEAWLQKRGASKPEAGRMIESIVAVRDSPGANAEGAKILVGHPFMSTAPRLSEISRNETDASILIVHVLCHDAELFLDMPCASFCSVNVM